MVTIERVRRPFWMHQIVEYILGFALIMTSIQQPEPRIPALMGLLILLNAAIVAGPAGAFKLDRKSTRLNSSHSKQSRMPSSA